MILVGLVVAGVAVSAALALQAFRSNVLFFFSPTEVVAGTAPV
jgi:cytochrome c-type biogenesis protein CcmE